MLKPIRVVVIDDEKQAREGIKLLLEAVPAFELVATCEDGLEAIENIYKHRPDLIFLDIQMPEINGFEVLNSLDNHQRPAVIFTTAYDQFALKAFEHHAIDYLLKPFTNERFYESLEYAKSILQLSTFKRFQHKMESLLKDYFQNHQPHTGTYVIGNHKTEKAIFSNKLTIKADGKIHFVPLEEIQYLEGYDSYIKIHTGEKTHIVKESLKTMEQKLPGQSFIRVHKSFIVNMKYVKTLEPYFNGDFYLILSSGKRLKGSRNFRKGLGKYTL